MKNSEPIRFLTRCLILIVLAFGPLAINQIRRSTVFESLGYSRRARALLAGESIRLEDDGLRPLKAAYIRQLPVRKAVLIMGSSRAATIASDWFPAGDAWNSAVPVGGIDDDAAFFEVCVETNRVPDTVILEIFPSL